MSKTPRQVYFKAFGATRAVLTFEEANEAALNAVAAHFRREALGDIIERLAMANLLAASDSDIERGLIKAIDTCRALLNASPGSGGQAPSTAGGADDSKSATISPPAPNDPSAPQDSPQGAGTQPSPTASGTVVKGVATPAEPAAAEGPPVINVPIAGEPLINGSGETPETDAVERICAGWDKLCWVTQGVVRRFRDLCRTLERQRDEARREIADFKENTETPEADALYGAKPLNYGQESHGAALARTLTHQRDEARRELAAARSATLPPEANELAAMMRDAKRYRWLREHTDTMSNEDGSGPAFPAPPDSTAEPKA